MNTNKSLLNFVFKRKDWTKIWEFYFSIWFLDRLIDVHIKYPKNLGYENRHTLHIYKDNKEDAFFLEKEISNLENIRRKKLLSKRYIDNHYKGANLSIKKMRQFIDNYLMNKDNLSSNLNKVFLEYSTLLEEIISFYRASRPEIFEIVENEMNSNISKQKKQYLKRLIFRYGKLRLDLKEAWLEAEDKSKKMKKKLAKQLDLKHKELEQLTNKEIISLFKGKTSLREVKRLIRKRKFCIFGLIKGKKILITGKEAKKIAKYISPPIKQIKEVPGKVAYPGIVTGRVRIIPQVDYQEMIQIAKRFKKGEVLVTGMTQPDVMMAIKKAGAIITDEGGITSHAAIISREFKIPCIIGTRMATKVLKDGDLVEVNANKGIIRTIK